MKSASKVWWDKNAARMDALSLRERAFLFVSFIVCCLALADVLWLAPAQLAYQQVTRSYAAQNAELKRLRDELSIGQAPVDVQKSVRDQVQAETDRLEAVNQEIKALVPLAEGGPALEQVLVQFLRRQEGLTLVSVGTAKQDAPAAGTVETGMQKRGLELRVSGSYAELTRYVKTLENALPALRWGAMHLKSDQQAPELSLLVYVVGAQP
jgi:MSHA biogenesis protein MshJ